MKSTQPLFKRVYRSLIAVLLLGTTVLGLAGTPPQNDQFAAATLVSAPDQTFGTTNADATAEPGETSHGGSPAMHSLWWQWLSDAFADVTVSVDGSGFAPVLSVYRGSSVNQLTLVSAGQIAESSSGRRLTFTATPQTSYSIAVDDTSGSGGPVEVRIVAAPVAPRISAQPKGGTVSVGSQFSMQVNAISSDPLTVQWWRDDQAIPGANSTRLSFTRLAATDSGAYHVTLSNKLGMAISTNAIVRVVVAPEIITQPNSLVLDPGQEGAFYVAAAGFGPFTYQWFKDGVPLSSLNQPSLRMPYVLGSDVGSYSVQVVNFFGSVQSASAKLALTRPPTPEESAVRILRVDYLQYSIEGCAGCLSAVVVGERPIAYQWYFDGQLLPGATNQIFRTPFGGPEHAGTYSLIATNSYGQATNPLPALYLYPVRRPPNDNFAQRLLLSGTDSVDTTDATAEPGEPIFSAGGRSVWWTWKAPSSGVVTITTIGTAFYSIISAYQGESLDELKLISRDASFSGYGRSKLTFATGPDKIFQLALDSRFGSGGSASVQIAFDPDLKPDQQPEVTTPPSPTNVFAGETLRLAVTVSGAHPLTFQWRREGVALPQFTNDVLEISDAQVEHAGRYTVTVGNRNGTITSDAFVVTVTPKPPIITSQPQGYTLTEGYPLSLRVVCTGSNLRQYFWSKDEILLSEFSGSELHLPHGLPESAGSYQVRIVNDQGATNSDSARIRVVGAPIQYRWSTLAGLPGSAGQIDGVGANARFYSPSGIAQEHSGDLLVADAGSGTIRRVTLTGTVTTLRNAVGDPMPFDFPVDIAVDREGAVLVQERARTTRVVPLGIGASISGGNWGVEIGPDGSIYQIDAGGGIYKVTADGRQILAVSRLVTPVAAAFDAAGSMYIAEADGPVIRRVDPDGTKTVLAGALDQFGSSDGPGSEARLQHPNSVSLDTKGNLFFADEFNDTIRRLGVNGVVTTVGGLSRVEGFADGVGSAARFSGPRRVLVASGGELYVVDTGNHVIRVGVPIETSPRLHIRRTGDQFEIFWEQSDISFELKTSDSLAPTSDWSPVSGELTVEGDLRKISKR